MGLAAQLRSLDDGRLAELLTARRDLVEHPARTFEQLAARAGAYGSQLACLSGLDLFLHQLLELVALAGSPTTVDRVADLAGPNVTRAEIAEGFGRLHDLGLVALDASSVRLVGELTTRLGVPGLGRPARLLLNVRTVEELRRVVAALDVRPALPSPRKADLLTAIAARLEDLPRLRQVLEGAPPEVESLLDTLDRQRCATLAYYGSFGFGGRPRPSLESPGPGHPLAAGAGPAGADDVGHGRADRGGRAAAAGRGPLPRHLGPSTAARADPARPRRRRRRRGGSGGRPGGRPPRASLPHPRGRARAAAQDGGPRRAGPAAAGRKQRAGRTRHRHTRRTGRGGRSRPLRRRRAAAGRAVQRLVRTGRRRPLAPCAAVLAGRSLLPARGRRRRRPRPFGRAAHRGGRDLRRRAPATAPPRGAGDRAARALGRGGDPRRPPGVGHTAPLGRRTRTPPRRGHLVPRGGGVPGCHRHGRAGARHALRAGRRPRRRSGRGQAACRRRSPSSSCRRT